MAGKLKLDDVDRQILRDLQDDGRMTNVELAKRAGISARHACVGCGCSKRPAWCGGTMLI